jgi:hypothetical protein
MIDLNKTKFSQQRHEDVRCMINGMASDKPLVEAEILVVLLALVMQQYILARREPELQHVL